MKINYIKRWNPETGTCYSQTIKIDKNIMQLFNKYLEEKKEEVGKRFYKNHCYSDWDLKLKSLDYLSEGINYTNLIHLQLFTEFYLKKLYIAPKKDKNFERVLYRNTILQVI